MPLFRTLQNFVVLLASIHCFTLRAQNKPTTVEVPSNPETRAIMDQIFANVTTVLSFSFKDSSFSSAENQPKIQKIFHDLASNSGELIKHAKGRDSSFEFVAQSLARDIKSMSRWYDRGNYSEARYLLHNLSENCVSCHTKLPSTINPPSADKFFQNINAVDLGLVEKAQLQTALRQFDQALDSYEKFFNSSDTKSYELVSGAALVEYLKINIRVKNDLVRPMSTLKAILAKKDLPKYLQQEVQGWIESLQKLAKNKPVAHEQNLVAARKIIKSAQARMEYPMDHQVLVDYIYASSLLNLFVNNTSAQKQKSQMSEAYYLLGLTELIIGRAYWISQAETYFESSIRIDPKTTFAKKSYSHLEKQVLFNYSGSSGIHIPDDVANNLSDLRQMLGQK